VIPPVVQATMVSAAHDNRQDILVALCHFITHTSATAGHVHLTHISEDEDIFSYRETEGEPKADSCHGDYGN